MRGVRPRSHHRFSLQHPLYDDGGGENCVIFVPAKIASKRLVNCVDCDRIRDSRQIRRVKSLIPLEGKRTPL